MREKELSNSPSQNTIHWFTGQIYRYETQKDLKLPYVDYNLLKENKEIALFKSKKILGRQLISRQFRLQFNYVDIEFAFKKNLYAIYNLDETRFSYFYLLSILNCKLYSFLIIKLNTSSQRDDFPALSLEDFRNFLIPEISKKAQAPFIKKVEKILTLKKENPQADTKKLETEIDKMVYKLYELTDEEIAIVEGK